MVADSKPNSQDAPCASAGTHRKQREGRNPRQEFARRHNESVLTRMKPAEGELFSFRIRTAPQRERFNTCKGRALAEGLEGVTPGYPVEAMAASPSTATPAGVFLADLRGQLAQRSADAAAALCRESLGQWRVRTEGGCPRRSYWGL